VGDVRDLGMVAAARAAAISGVVASRMPVTSSISGSQMLAPSATAARSSGDAWPAITVSTKPKAACASWLTRMGPSRRPSA